MSVVLVFHIKCYMYVLRDVAVHLSVGVHTGE